ncbi:MAG: PLD nuclease N-terminal domain-containing protein [Actinomycetes bacterium]|jgi:Phospholipase_D-nuclease N-terminal
MVKLDALIAFLWLGAQIYSIIDIARRPQEEFTRGSKWVWLLFVAVLFIGSLAWIFWGRNNQGGGRPPRRRPTRDLPPDDNPDFLRNL